MSYKLLFILLEGDDDERFFEKIVKPFLQKRYSAIKIWKYSQQKQEKIVNLVKSINSMKADYIYARDLNDAPCVTAKKESITGKFNQIAESKIIVVVKEIESWYLAGLDENTSKKVSIRKKIRTEDSITKEEFNLIIPKNMPRIELMRKILENYDVEIAKERSSSFGYFLNKWGK
jgi:serine kinase of HPr protein (carbohydrate metabolism regulator)